MDNLPHYHFSFQRNQLKNDMINAIKEVMKMSSNKYLDDDFQAYLTCDCSIYEAVYNRLNSL